MSKWGLLFTTEVLFYDNLKKNKIELVVKNNENQSVPERHILINRRTIGGWKGQNKNEVIDLFRLSHEFIFILKNWKTCKSEYILF